MFALLAGFQLAGVLGGLFAVPVAGVLWVLIGTAYRNAVARPARARRWVLPSWRRAAGSTAAERGVPEREVPERGVPAPRPLKREH